MNKLPARIHDPHIGAVINGGRSKSLEEARAKLQKIRNQFHISKDSDPEDMNSLILWIKDFEVMPEEKEQGYAGHFAKLTIAATPNVDGFFMISIEKQPKDLRFHPIKGFSKQHKHPNDGHPILRSVKRGEVYPSKSDAQAALQSLHEQYTEVTIPADNFSKLFIHVFGRHYGEPPIKKDILEVEQVEEGFIITRRDNPGDSVLRRPKIDEVYDEPYFFALDR